MPPADSHAYGVSSTEANQIKTLLDTGVHQCDDFCKSLIMIIRKNISDDQRRSAAE
ncbi:MAG: hypothetical protein AB1711_04935 [Thermodesulfobacteriota bacterium]